MEQLLNNYIINDKEKFNSFCSNVIFVNVYCLYKAIYIEINKNDENLN